MTITRCAVKSWPVLGFTAVLLGYGAIKLSRWTASALRDRAYDNVAVGLFGLLFLVSTLFLTVGAAAPILRPVVTSGESELAFTPNRSVRIAVTSAWVSALLWAAAAGLLKALGRLRVAGDSYLIKALPLIGLVSAVLLGWILLKRRAFPTSDRLTVTLAPHGIAGLNYGGAKTVSWAQIADVAEANGIIAGLPIGLAHLVIRTGDGSAYPVHQSQFCGGPVLTDAIRSYLRDVDRV